MFVFGGNNSGIRDDYKINNSLRFRSSASAYLSKTPASNGTTTKWTISFWVKRGTLGTLQYIRHGGQYNVTNGYKRTSIRFNADDTFDINEGQTNVSASLYRLQTTQVFRDPSAWYHIVAAVDTTQATASNRMKIYVNGVQVTSFTTATYYALNYTTQLNSTEPQQWGVDNGGASKTSYFDGYLAECYVIDGQQLDATSFGYTHPKTGVWRPKPYTGTYGTNGTYFKYSDIATTSSSNAGLGKDFSGNGNYFTTNNISVTSGTTYDAMTDSPTLSGSASNYAVINPLDQGAGNALIFDANLKFNNAGASYKGARASFDLLQLTTSYWEITVDAAVAGSKSITVGVATNTADLTNTSNSLQWVFQCAYNAFYANSGTATFDIAGGTSAGDVLRFAFNSANGNFWVGNATGWFSSTGTYTGDPATNTNPVCTISVSNVQLMPFVQCYATFVNANFGQRPFTYTPPTGYKALNTYNLPNVTIPKGNKVMDATTWSGNGSTQIITNTSSFKPDLVWIKKRGGGTVPTRDHRLFDAVRGATKYLSSNLTSAETTETDGLTSFDSTGFTLGASDGVNGTTGGTGTYVGWQWQAGQGTTSSNTQGSITSTVSVNATAGFSVVTYTGNGTGGSTIGHGLGVVPSMIIVKRRDTAGWDWMTKHKSLSSGNCILLNSTAAQSTLPSYGIISDLSSSTTFSVTTGSINANQVNASGATYVAYCWAEIAGFSKFGSYAGNGSTDGTFVYLGFRPKFILIKRTITAGSSWFIIDSTRNTYNVTNLGLSPDTSGAEFTGTTTTIPFYDMYSNGFKVRGTSSGMNSATDTYIYAAFAENPFKYSLAR